MLVEWKNTKKEIEVSGTKYPAVFCLPFLGGNQMVVGDYIVSDKEVMQISCINYGMKDKEGKIFVRQYKKEDQKELSKKKEVFTLTPM